MMYLRLVLFASFAVTLAVSSCKPIHREEVSSPKFVSMPVLKKISEEALIRIAGTVHKQLKILNLSSEGGWRGTLTKRLTQNQRLALRDVDYYDLLRLQSIEPYIWAKYRKMDLESFRKSYTEVIDNSIAQKSINPSLRKEFLANIEGMHKVIKSFNNTDFFRRNFFDNVEKEIGEIDPIMWKQPPVPRSYYN